MRPVRTAGSNFVYRGPNPDISDAWVRRGPGARVMLTWELDDEDRAAIAAGATLELGIYGMEPIPPVSIEVSHVQPLSREGSALRDRALRALVAERREDSPSKPGWWVVSEDVWLALCAERALDPVQGVPTLLGRPLITLGADGPLDVLEFNNGQQAEARA